jgi:hypothetical protein
MTFFQVLDLPVKLHPARRRRIIRGGRQQPAIGGEGHTQHVKGTWVRSLRVRKFPLDRTCGGIPEPDIAFIVAGRQQLANGRKGHRVYLIKKATHGQFEGWPEGCFLRWLQWETILR